jgi:hypothetical protein
MAKKKQDEFSFKITNISAGNNLFHLKGLILGFIIEGTNKSVGASIDNGNFFAWYPQTGWTYSNSENKLSGDL